MKHHTPTSFACIGTFCALVTLPALAAPTGTITRNEIALEMVPDPYGGPLGQAVFATTRHQVNNDSAYTFTAYFEDHFATQNPDPAATYGVDVRVSKLSQTAPRKKSLVYELKASLGYYGPNWVYVSSAILFDASKITPFPEDWLASKSTSKPIP